MTAIAPRRRSLLWLQGLACGAALALGTGPVILLAVLLAPGLLTCVIERKPGRPVGGTMLLLGAAASFTPLRILWENGRSVDACMDILSNPSPTGLAWLAAGMGWLMEEGGQIIARQYSDISTRRRIAHLLAERAKLVEEWGPLEPPPPAPPGNRRR